MKLPILMGILNTTPDSFHDGGSYAAPPAALKRAHDILAQGAEIIDIGGESTRPGAAPVSVEEEIRRTAPLIKAIRQKFPAAQISIDTYNYETARAALEAGANIINDVSALKDAGLARLAARTKGAKLVIMHARGTPKNMQAMCDYKNILAEIYEFFEVKIKEAAAAGMARENIILDVGLGFAKTSEQNWFLLENLKYFSPLGLPQLIGASRKRFTGGSLELSLKAAEIASQNGAAILRVHDVIETKKMLEAL
ncbi:MAG: dihydropteroate synthase [Elusimicrobiota bacterium]|jgi:dihydropteroate synthase|nr:dihydropteroate synthase [Elusimicrobiota bacterium]